MLNFANFVGPFTLATALTNSPAATSVVVNESIAATPAANFKLVINEEVVLVTAKNVGTRTFTVERAIEGTIANHAIGSPVRHRVTAGDLADFRLGRLDLDINLSAANVSQGVDNQITLTVTGRDRDLITEGSWHVVGRAEPLVDETTHLKAFITSADSASFQCVHTFENESEDAVEFRVYFRAEIGTRQYLTHSEVVTVSPIVSGAFEVHVNPPSVVEGGLFYLSVSPATGYSGVTYLVRLPGDPSSEAPLNDIPITTPPYELNDVLLDPGDYEILAVVTPGNVRSSNVVAVSVISPEDLPDLKAAILRQPARETVGVQDFDFSSFGFSSSKPIKAALVHLTQATTNLTPEAPNRYAFGVLAGNGQRSVGFRSQDGSASTSARVICSTTAILNLINNSTNGIQRLASASIVDGTTVRLNHTTVLAGGHIITVCALGGDDLLEAGVDHQTQANNGSTVYNVGFADPSALILFSGNTPFDQAVSSTGLGTMMGIAVNASPIQQGSFCYREQNAQSPTVCRTGLSNTLAMHRARLSSTNSFEVSVSVTSFNNGSGGIVMTGSAGTGTPTDFAIGVLGLKFSEKVACKLHFIDSPTSVGEAQIMGAPGIPAFVFHLFSMMTAYGVVNTGDGGVWGMGFMTQEAAASVSQRSRIGVATTETRSLTAEAAVAVNSHDGSTAFRASFETINNGGWTWNFTNVDATPRKWLALSISAAL